MNPTEGRVLWERGLLLASAAGVVLGSISAAAGYFVTPQAATMKWEYAFTRVFPTYADCLALAGLALLTLWLCGCLLLLGRALRIRRVPWEGLACAALSPVLLLLSNSVFMLAVRHIAPLSIGR
ncbi:MAG: hypothetical protein SFU85_11280 [Candidatus Methylacidiphilales bacterium]|nr:hypothetical protein [Candidatus Methylacidiphilales bacterium]